MEDDERETSKAYDKLSIGHWSLSRGVKENTFMVRTLFLETWFEKPWAEFSYMEGTKLYIYFIVLFAISSKGNIGSCGSSLVLRQRSNIWSVFALEASELSVQSTEWSFPRWLLEGLSVLQCLTSLYITAICLTWEKV